MLHVVSHNLLYQDVQNLYCTGTKTKQNKKVVIMAWCGNTGGEFYSQFNTLLVLHSRVQIRPPDKAEVL